MIILKDLDVTWHKWTFKDKTEEKEFLQLIKRYVEDFYTKREVQV